MSIVTAGLTTEITSEVCADRVLEVVPLVMRCLRAEIRRQGQPLLSVPQLRTMIFLKNFPGSSLSSVAEHLGVTKATASTLVEKLVKRGLINRVEHPQERRRHVLTLTAAGIDVFEEVRLATRSRLASLLENLSENQLIQINAGISLLEDIFTEVTPAIEN